MELTRKSTFGDFKHTTVQNMEILNKKRQNRVFMIPEPYLGLIIGSMLTLIVSVVSIFLTNHYSEKQWMRQKKLEEHEKAVEQIYSPLCFILLEADRQMGFIGGLFKAYLDRGISNGNVQNDFLKWSRDYGKKKRSSQFIEDTLRTKLGLIKPIEFQIELIRFCFLLNEFDLNLLEIDEHTFENEEPSDLERRFRNYVKLTAYYYHVIEHFFLFVEYQISGKEEIRPEYKYKIVLNEAVQKKIDELLKQPSDLKIEAEADEWLDKNLKEISRLNQNLKAKENL